MNVRGTGKSTVAAVLAWMAFGGLAALRLSGAEVPAPAMAVAAGGALALAVAEAARNVLAIWRGPTIVNFSGDEAEVCGPEEAQAIRAAARLRGTLGGAGHVHARRLLLPATAWLAAAVLAGGALVDPGLESVPGWPVAVVAAGIGGAVLFPPRPFYYREAMGGRVVVHPRSARAQLVVPPPVQDHTLRPAAGEADEPPPRQRPAERGRTEGEPAMVCRGREDSLS